MLPPSLSQIGHACDVGPHRFGLHLASHGGYGAAAPCVAVSGRARAQRGRAGAGRSLLQLCPLFVSLSLCLFLSFSFSFFLSIPWMIFVFFSTQILSYSLAHIYIRMHLHTYELFYLHISFLVFSCHTLLLTLYSPIRAKATQKLSRYSSDHAHALLLKLAQAEQTFYRVRLQALRSIAHVRWSGCLL